MEKSLVHNFYRFSVLLAFCVMLAGFARADTFHLLDGRTIVGDMVSQDENGFIVKQPDDTYADRTPWGKLTQDNLKELQQNPKLTAFVEPFIEVTQQQKREKTEIVLKDVPRLPRPPGHSLIAAFFTSTMGLFIVVLLYAANIYAGYEVSIFRAQPAALVCGVAAVLPVLGPIIFLAMPTRMQRAMTDEEAPMDENLEAAIAAEQEAPGENPAKSTRRAAAGAGPAVSNLPATKTFPRGQFTFNRRFFETQVPTFFGVVRSEADKDMVLSIKSLRGTHTVQRISRISSNEMYVQVQKGHASEEIVVQFAEIQEVQLKHKDA